ESAMGQAEGAVAYAGDLVTVIAMHAVCCNAPRLAQIAERRVVGGSDRRRVAGRANAGAVGVLGEQVPADVGVPLPVAAVEEIAETAVCRGTGVTACRPLAVDLAVAVATVLGLRRVGRGIDPRVGFIVLLGQTRKQNVERRVVGRDSANKEALFPSSQSLRG